MPTARSHFAGDVPAHMRDSEPAKESGPALIHANEIVAKAIAAMNPDSPGADPELQRKMAIVIRKLHELIDELNLQQHELLAAYTFLDKVGANSDMMLLGDHLGVSMRVNDLTYRGAVGTLPNVIGPLYRESAPFMENPGAMVSPDVQGRHIWVEGVVTDAISGAPVVDAVLDFWQTDSKGFYDYQSSELRDFDYRRKIAVDAKGRFAFRTIVPAAYEIANRDTPVTDLMLKLGRRSYRAPHIHVIVTAKGYRSLTTLIYFDGEEFNDEDCIFSCRPENMVAIERGGGSEGLDLCRFNVQLVPLDR
jgi:protocatechuate 3,4-dioxygenase beta subunit